MLQLYDMDVIFGPAQKCNTVLTAAVIAGWLRSNDRAIALTIAFNRVPNKEHRRWKEMLEASEAGKTDQNNAAEIELHLRYEDGSIMTRPTRKHRCSSLTLALACCSNCNFSQG